MFFRRKPKPPLALAVELAEEAVAVAYSHWRDRGHRPTRADLRMFRQLEQVLFRGYGTVRRLGIRMERRFHGEPEVDDRKWSR